MTSFLAEAKFVPKCGRTACTLAPDDIIAACTYSDKNGEKKPQWVDAPNGQKYYPSYNKAPTSINPVITSSCHVNSSGTKLDSSHIIMPMKWGMTPSWHKGNRCVVLADGFFEWNTSKEGKQPFLFHLPQPENVKFPFVSLETGKKEWTGCDNKEEIKTEDVEKNEFLGSFSDVVCNVQVKKEKVTSEDLSDAPERAGPRLLTMAGVFDIWHPQDGPSPLFSYSIITVPSSADMQWCHHRMPAILTTDEEIQDWLDFANVICTFQYHGKPKVTGSIPSRLWTNPQPVWRLVGQATLASRGIETIYGTIGELGGKDENIAVSLIKPKECLTYHPVAKAVNNSRYQAIDCVKPIHLGKTKSSASSNLMLSWLKSGSPAKKRKI
ncbi:hypothetical protein Btru_069750 [Bulinus truncatus]|nr:hypothetical protein Btru_069750 [Bulinus truncatus]